MTKTFSIFAACTIVAGCAVQRKSPVWQQVVDAPRVSPSGANTSDAYAKNLHATLQKAGVPHKVVTYNYPFSSKFDGAGTAQRTSVIYRDPSSPAYPWWIMDERLSRPIWLPTESVQHQVNFFLRRPVQVVTLREYGEADGKSVAHPVSVLPTKQSARAQFAPTTKMQPVVHSGAPDNRLEQPLLITRIWRNTKSLFRDDSPAPAVPIARVERVAPPAISRIEPVQKPEPARIQRIAPAVVEKVAPSPVVAEGPKRPLFRPAGAKLRPFFSTF